MRALFAIVLLALTAALPVAAESTSAGARANRHALIIGVGTYQDSRISPLRGVVHDVANARQMAEQMGVPAANLIILQDRDANSTRIRAELRALAERVRDGDRVFVYFSGHGARYSPPEAAGACREALVPWDAEVSRPQSLLGQEEIAAEIAPVYAKADKVFVFIDACHSGGVRATTRAVGQAADADDLVPKFTVLGSGSQCRVASNVRTRSVLEVARTRGAPGRNVVQFASSRPDEVSLDSPQFGGLATSSWRYCSVYAEDADGSGNLSVEEITGCVQRRIDQRLAGNPRYTGQTVQVSGNVGFAPFLAVQAGAMPPAYIAAVPPAPATAPVPATPPQEPSTAMATAVALPVATPAVANTLGTAPALLFPLDSVVAQSDARHIVTVEHPRAPLRIGRDYFDLTVSSNRGGYVYLILQSSDRQNTYVLFPNSLDQSNHLRPGEVMRLPRPSWRLQSQGPAGTNRLLVMVTDAPRDLSVLRASPTGPFVKTLSDAAASRSLAWLVGSAKGSSGPGCSQNFASKDLIYVDQCSDSFGARIVEFNEQ